MGVETDEPLLYRGETHRWRRPPPDQPLAFLLFAIVIACSLLELVAAGLELLLFGHVRLPTARTFAIVGIAVLAVANIKSVVMALRPHATETLGGALDDVMRPMWSLHFWLNPLAVFSLGLFLLFAPRPQSPFYFIAYGILLWQTFAGLLAREALPIPQRRGEVGRLARAMHRQPAIYVLLVVLVAAGFVDSLFP